MVVDAGDHSGALLERPSLPPWLGGIWLDVASNGPFSVLKVCTAGNISRPERGHRVELGARTEWNRARTPYSQGVMALLVIRVKPLRKHHNSGFLESENEGSPEL
jgi:hypothetical protein